MHPGAELTDEEFLERYRVFYSNDGVFSVGRADTNDWDYEYVPDDGTYLYPGWSFRGQLRRGVNKWFQLKDERIIGLLKMVIFPQTVD